MIIPDNEVIVYKTYNELKRARFYLQGFIISLIPLSLMSSIYILLLSKMRIYYYFIIIALYIILSIITGSKMYKDFLKYFGADELAFSSTKVYYNICMNKGGININIDDNHYISEIKDYYIKKGWNPKRLIISFNDDTYIAVHSLKDIDGVISYLDSIKANNLKNM